MVAAADPLAVSDQAALQVGGARGLLELRVEALLFATPEPLSLGDLCRLLGDEEGGDAPEDEVSAAVKAVEQRLEGSALTLQRLAGGLRMATRPEHGELLRQLFSTQRNRALSPAALDTLAIVAYRQPITRAEVEAIRGVDSGGILLSLSERHLTRVCGRKRGVRGTPYLYGTTDHFLQVFGLGRIEDLPPLEPPADFSPLVAPHEQTLGPDEAASYPLFEEALTEEDGEPQQDPEDVDGEGSDSETDAEPEDD